MANNSKFVKFEVLKIEDTRKKGSTIRVGGTYKGLKEENSNCIYYSDINEQDWVFYVDDTCKIIEEIDQLKTF